MDNEHEEIQDEQPVLVGVEYTPAVTPKYIYLWISKFYMQINTRAKTDDMRGGFSLMPPFGEYVLVAFPRHAREHIKEDLREGAISITEFEVLFYNMADMGKMFRARFANTQEGF